MPRIIAFTLATLGFLYGLLSYACQTIAIAVDRGYEPSTVTAKAGEPVDLVFERKTDLGCTEEVVFDDFKITRKLPVGQKVTIHLDSPKPGTYAFHCGMNMLQGSLVVK